MAAGTSLGEGVGLQSGQRSNYWMGRAADDLARKRAIEDARKAKEQDDLIKSADFDVDYGVYLPYYGNKIAEIQRGLYQNLAKVRQDNGSIPIGTAKDMVLRAKQEMAVHQMDNAVAKKYIEDQDIHHNQGLVKALYNPQTTPEELAGFSDGLLLNISPSGGFRYIGVPMQQPEVKYDINTDFTTEISEAENVGGYRWVNKDKSITEDAINRESNQLAANKDFLLQSLQRGTSSGQLPKIKPGQSLSDYMVQDEVVEFVRQDAYREAERQAYKGSRDKVKGKANPSPSKSKSSKEKLTPVIEYDITYETPDFSKEAKDGVRPTKTSRSPFSVATPDVKPVTLSRSKQMFDARTGKVLQGSEAFSFKPDAIQPRNISYGKTPKDGAGFEDGSKGEWQLFVLGTVVQNTGQGGDGSNPPLPSDSGGGAEKSETVRNILVPLEGSGVKSAIEGKYDLTDLYNEFDQIKSSKSLKDYNSQIQKAIQAYMKSSGLSETEALKKLRAAGKID